MNTAHSSSSSTATPPTTTPLTNSTTLEPLPCPRCNSRDTKFCYYNNYNLTQPRHYCRTCRRYWTQGGTLRNVPVGGGCRKNKQVVPTEPTIYRPQATNRAAWNHNPNPSFPVLDAQMPGMVHNGFQLIQSEVVPVSPFQVDAPGLGFGELNQRISGYTGNFDAFRGGYESYDSSTAELGSISDSISVNGSEFGYWNPGSAWSDYPATSGAFP